MDPLFEIRIERAKPGSRDSARSLHRQLIAAIADGRLQAGVRLPATRHAEALYGVSRNTAIEVYERLLNEGYAVSRRGSGTFVAAAIAAAAPRALPKRRRPADRRLNPFWLQPEVGARLGFWQERPQPTLPPRHVTPIDFRPALIDSRLFPFEVFRQVSAKQLRKSERRPASYKSAHGNQGHYPLRAAITKHIALTRAVVCRPEDIVVTSGAQQAFDLLARILVKPNETVVAFEDPGYPPMRVAFAAAGARAVPVAVDAEGLIVEQLPPETGVICLCPSHQFPLGVAMSMRRRKALIEFARRRGAVILEDDYDGEFRYDGSPLEALKAIDSGDVVFYVGTFSKCMLPALRLGFIIGPDWAMPTLIAAKNCLDWHCSMPVQTSVAEFITAGHLARHVRQMRSLYKQRRERLLSVLAERFGEWLEPIPSFYGMHIGARSRAAASLDRVVESLAQCHVRLHTFSRYFLGAPSTSGLIFGYGAADPAQIERGLDLLHKALRR